MIGVILAAGYATRLFPLTKEKPKALLNVNSKPVVEYMLDDLEKFEKIKKVYLVTNHKFYNQFEGWLDREKYKKVILVDDGSEDLDDRLGALGDLNFVIEKYNIDDDLFVLAADNLLENGLKDVYISFLENRKNTIVIKENMDIEDLKSMGVAELDAKNKVVSFEEKPDKPKSTNGVYAVYLYKKEALDYLNKFIEEQNRNDSPGYFPQWLIDYEDIFAVKIEGEIFDIGTFDNLDEARKYFRKEK